MAALDFSVVEAEYVVNDGSVDSNVATVSLTITAVNDAPDVENQLVTGAEDTALLLRWADFGALCFAPEADASGGGYPAAGLGDQRD